jgi:hypothetical protein
MENNNSELLGDFSAYCAKHPEQRFWQALRNWAEVSFVYVATGEGADHRDTYYFEGRES